MHCKYSCDRHRFHACNFRCIADTIATRAPAQTQSRICTRAASARGRDAADAQRDTGANSGHGSGHRTMKYFWGAPCDALCRGVIIQAHIYNLAVASLQMRSVALTQIRVTETRTEICSHFLECPAMRNVGESSSRRACTALRSRRRKCAAWRWREFGSRKRAPEYVPTAWGTLRCVRSGRHYPGAHLQHCCRDAANARLGDGASSGHGNGHRNMFHCFGAPCDA